MTGSASVCERRAPDTETIVVSGGNPRSESLLSEACLQFRTVLVMVMLCAASAVPVGAESLSSILRHSNYSTSEQHAIQSTFHQTDTEDIPRKLLLPRLEQGIERGVPPQAVIEVLKRSADLLIRARELLQSVSGGERFIADTSSWSLTATVLGVGRDESMVRDIARASGGSEVRYRSALLLYGSLASWGLEASAMLSVTLAAIHSPLPAAQYSAISDIFVRGRSLQIPPQRLVLRVLRALPQSRNYEDLQRSVLY